MRLPGVLPWVRVPASVASKTVHLAGVGPRSRDAHGIVMDVLAQSLAARLQTRTMVYSADLGEHRRYRYVRAMTRNKGCVLLDEKTGRPPKGLF